MEGYMGLRKVKRKTSRLVYPAAKGYHPAFAIGVQALSIRMAYELCQHEPELLQELQLILENTDTEYYSTGVKTTIRNTLKKIRKQRR